MTELIEATLQFSLTEHVQALSVSKGIEQLLGYKAIDILEGNTSLQSRLHPDDQDILDEVFSKNIKEPYAEFNLRLRHADGRIRCIKASYTKQQKTGEEAIIVDLLLQDAKSLWQTSSELPMMTNFKAMMENTDDYIYFKDQHHVFTGASQTLVSLTNPSENWTDLLGQTDYDVFSEHYADIYYQLEKLVFSGIYVAHEVQEILDNNGEKGWVDNRKYPMHDEDGEIIGLFGIARDITEHQLQQQKIEQLLAEKSVVLDNNLVGIVTVKDRHILWANAAFESMLGYDEDEVIAYPTRHFYVNEADYLMVGKAYANIDSKEGVVRNEIEFLRKDGSCIWFDMRGSELHHETKESIWVFADVTERKLAEEQLRDSEKRLRLSQVSGGIGTWEYNYQTDTSICSDNVFQELGFPRSEDNSSWDDVFAAILPEDHDNVNRIIEQHITQGSPLDFEYRITNTEGKLRWMRSIGKVEFNTNHEPFLMRGTIQDITAKKIAEDEVRISAVAFETQEGMLITDANSIVVKVNHAFTDITGYTFEDIVGKTPNILQSGQHDAAFYQSMWETIEQTGRWEGEVTNRHKQGHLYFERLTITAVKNAQGVVINYIGTHTDITERKEIESQVEILAFYDYLTELPNRRLFMDRLQQAVKITGRRAKSGALLFLDLDHFKELNDTQGHHIGDLLLQQVAERLKMSVREGDTVARFGGDEFVVMLEDLHKNPSEAAGQAEVIARKILTTLNQAYLLAGSAYTSSTSIGISMFGAENRSDMNELLKQADIAMYAAKHDGRNAFHFFDSKMLKNT